MLCPTCGREMVSIAHKQPRCASVACARLSWRNADKSAGNVVELTPAVERDCGGQGREFVGTLYVREVRVVDGYPCQGISVSTIASGPSKSEVRTKTMSAAKQRADSYELRGYQVTLKKRAAA